jgi:hypothetical protein
MTGEPKKIRILWTDDEIDLLTPYSFFFRKKVIILILPLMEMMPSI